MTTLFIDRARILRALLVLLENVAAWQGAVISLEVIQRESTIRFSAVDESPSLLHVTDPAALGLDSLGLRIAKRIVEAHGGRVGVERIPNKGTSFWFDLPGEPAVLR